MFDSLRRRLAAAVQRQRTKAKTLTVVFADVVGSTALYEALGDVRARQVVGERLDGMQAAVRKEGGRVVKSLGDGILGAFPAASPAVSAALAIAHVDDGALPVHVGVHLGETLTVAGDVFGDTVNTAARIADLAKPGEVLLSRTVLDAMPAGYGRLVRPVAPIEVKGKLEPLELFAAVRFGGHDELATLPSQGIASLAAGAACAVSLRWRGRELCVDAARPRVTIGRAEDNDLSVDAPNASRHHAWIEVGGGKATLGDQSSNGTLLVTADGQRLRVHRDRAPLIGAGRIYLGGTPDGGDEGVEFRVGDAGGAGPPAPSG